MQNSNVINLFEENEDKSEIHLDKEQEEVDLTHSRLAKIQGFEAMHRLRVLCLRWNLIKKIENLDQLGPTLTRLDLYDNQIETIESLGALVNLNYLDLSFNRIRRIEGLEELRQLQTLYLVHNKIKQIEGLQNQTQLELLELGDNRITTIENVAHLTNLRQLFLGANRINTIQNLHTLTKLTTLSLPANRIQVIQGLTELSDLRELYLSQNGITKLEGMENQKELRILDINLNLLAEFENVSHMRQLTDCWASHNKFESLEQVVDQLKDLSHLSLVYMEGNPFARTDQYRRKMILGLPQITRLDATPCKPIVIIK